MWEIQIKYFASYKISKEGSKIFEDVNHAGNPYFQVSSKTQLLEDRSNNIWVSGATFQSRAKVSNLNFKTKDSERLSELQELCVQMMKSGS